MIEILDALAKTLRAAYATDVHQSNNPEQIKFRRVKTRIVGAMAIRSRIAKGVFAKSKVTRISLLAPFFKGATHILARYSIRKITATTISSLTSSPPERIEP